LDAVAAERLAAMDRDHTEAEHLLLVPDRNDTASAN
jgi:hypothetical protein